jgi:hypothetical protein
VKKQSVLQAACRVAGVDPALVETVRQDGPDLFLTLITKRTVRVELSALPAEVFGPETDVPTEPAPEHTTLTEPAPVKAKKSKK